MNLLKIKIRFAIFNIIMLLIEFFLYSIRNTFLVTFSIFMFASVSLSIIFVQEEVDASPFSSISVFVRDLPFGTFQEPKQITKDDLASFFITTSFYLTLCTEGVRNIRKYVFKKESSSSKDSLRKRIYFVIMGTIVIHGFAFMYMTTKFPDHVFGVFVTLAFFWAICCISGIFFLKMGPFIEGFHSVIARFRPATD